MKQKILIIEDKIGEYEAIINSLDKNKYDFLPWFKDSNNNGFEEMEEALNKDEILEYITICIQNNYSTLRVIICDLLFLEYDIQGHDIISHIRNNIEVQKMKLFTKLIPIISYTNHSNKEFAQKAILNGATHNIQKGQSKYFSDIVNAACDYFRSSYIDREINNIEKFLEENKQLLLENNKIISSNFDNVELLIRGNQVDTIYKFDLLFRSFFETLDASKKQQLFEKFKADFVNLLTIDEIERINQSIWDKIQNEIISINKGAGFKTVVDAIYDILKESGMLDTKGKIIGSGIKGIFGVLAS